MRTLAVVLAMVAAYCFVGGCGSPQPDEKQVHEMLSKPPSRPKNHGGVGQKKLEQQGGGPAAPAPAGQ